MADPNEQAPYPWNASDYATWIQPSEYSAPSGTWEERALRQATVVVTLPRDAVQALVRPPLPQIGPTRVRHMGTPTVEDVIVYSARDQYPDRRTSFSGSPAGYSGSDRNGGWGGAF